MAAWRYKKRNVISPRGYVVISAMSKTVLCTYNKWMSITIMH